MVMLPKAPQELVEPTEGVNAPQTASELDAAAQRALQIASGEALKEIILETQSRPSSGATSTSSRGGWAKKREMSEGQDGDRTPRSGRSVGSTPRSGRSVGSAPRSRPRTTGSQRRDPHKQPQVPQRPATSQTARPTDRLSRLEQQKAALTERLHDAFQPRTASFSTWRGVASDTAGVVPPVYAPVPRQRVSCNSARRRTVAKDARLGSKMRRKRMDRQRETELEMYKRAFTMIDRDCNGTVEPAEILHLLRSMGRDPSGSKFWETFRAFDENDSSQLDFEEFKAVMDTLPRSTRVLGDGFRHIARMEARGAHHQPRMPKEYRKASVPKQPLRRRRALVERQQVEQEEDGAPSKQSRAGTSFLGDALEMKRQVADIYATMSSLRQQSVRSKILDLPQDAKLRTKEGRRQAEFDIATAREIQSLKNDVGPSDMTRKPVAGHSGNNDSNDSPVQRNIVRNSVTANAAVHAMQASVNVDVETQRRAQVLAASFKARSRAQAVSISTKDAMQQFADLFAGDF